MEEKNYDEQRVAIRNEITELQQFYVDGVFENLPQVVEQRKVELIDKLVDFKENHIKYKYDKYGNGEPIINPYLVSTYFFTSLNSIGNISPNYSPENMSIVWNVYQYLVEQVNLEICPFSPSLTHFCKFAGISTGTLKNYKNSFDKNMREIVEKIYDACYDGQMVNAQCGATKERSTIWRMKTENEVVEKKTPNVNVNISEKVDIKEVNDRLNNILNFGNKTIDVENTKVKEVKVKNAK